MKSIKLYYFITILFFITNLYSIEVKKIDVEEVETVDEAYQAIEDQKKLQAEAEQNYKNAINDEAISERNTELLKAKLDRKDLTESQRQRTQESLEKWSTKLSEDYNRVQRTKTAFDQADFNVKQLEARKNQLAATTTVVHTKEQFLNQYELNIKDRLDEINNQKITFDKKQKASAILIDLEYQDVTQLGEDYSWQKDKLNALNDAIVHTHFGKDDDRIRDLIDSRLDEINAFQKYKIRPLKDNKIDADLQLATKIPTDQMQTINQFSDQLISDLNALVDIQIYDSVPKIIKTINDLNAALEYYSREYSQRKENKFIDILNQTKPKIEEIKRLAEGLQILNPIEVPGINPEDLKETGAIPNLTDRVGEFAPIPTNPEEKSSFFSQVREKVSKFVRYPVDQVKRGIVYVLETVGVNFAYFGIGMKDLGPIVKDIPQMAETTATTLDNISNNWLVSGGIAAMRKSPISSEKMKAYSTSAESGLKGAKSALDQVKEAGRLLNKIKAGEILEGVGQASVWIADRIGKAAGTDKVKNIFLIDSVERLIAQENKKLQEEEPLISPSLTQQIQETIAPLINGIRDLFGLGKWNESIADKTATYERAKENFNPFMDNTIEPVLNSAHELATEYEKIAATIRFSDESISFITDDWNNFQFDQKAEIASVLEAFFDLRNKKLALLREIRKEVASMKDTLPQQVNDYSAKHLTQQQLSMLDSLVTGQAIKTITEYNEAITTILKKLGDMKQKYLQPKK